MSNFDAISVSSSGQVTTFHLNSPDDLHRFESSDETPKLPITSPDSQLQIYSYLKEYTQERPIAMTNDV